MRTSSMPASTVESPAPSCASNRTRIVWPAHRSTLAAAEPHVPETALVDPTRSHTTVWVPPGPSTIARRWSAVDDDPVWPNSQRNVSRWPVPAGRVMARERAVVRPARAHSPADAPARAPVTNATEPDGTTSDWRTRPPLVAEAWGFARTHRPDAGDVSVPSGLTVQPRPTSRSSSNAPQRAVRTESPRTASGHHARSMRYSTAFRLRDVSGPIIESFG